MIPGPRPSEGHASPSDGDRAQPSTPAAPGPAAVPVSLIRSPRGWTVHSPAGVEEAADLIEGLSLADLVAEELSGLIEPDRTTRRSARGPGDGPQVEDDGTDPRVAALERTVAQLEHALAARVSTERAIGVLAERHGTDARAAFETMRRDARSQGRPVAELAREVLDGLASGAESPPEDTPRPAPPPPGSLPAGSRPPDSVVAAVMAPGPRPRRDSAHVTAADGRS
jgi:hypothetical protein